MFGILPKVFNKFWLLLLLLYLHHCKSVKYCFLHITLCPCSLPCSLCNLLKSLTDATLPVSPEIVTCPFLADRTPSCCQALTCMCSSFPKSLVPSTFSTHPYWEFPPRKFILSFRKQLKNHFLRQVCLDLLAYVKTTSSI